ncbi:MAG: cell division protein FtsA [Tannerella sp.]|jgi:cell division protein FtsA|nr:cell division protein FtsA [Tannerella sp.]
MVANYIVVIDIETSRLIGMAGRKNEDGRISVLAVEEEKAGGSIRRGNIYHKEEAAGLIKRLVEKLQNRISGELPDYRIRKVYVGVGGQSLRSIDHTELKSLSLGATVTKSDLQVLDEQCRAYRPELDDVVGIAPPVYYVDGKRVEQAEGLPATYIEARYKQITGRPSIRTCVMDCVQRAGLQLAGLIVSPLALAEATLGREEKEAGCALIGFHTGVTSVAVYRHSELVHLSVIPLGAGLIIGDLVKTLKLQEQDAEWLKRSYGLSLAEKEKSNGYPQGAIAINGQEVEPRRLNAVIEGRVKEIVENVHECVRLSGDIASLGAGIVLAGNESNLKELPELLRQRFKLEITSATIRQERMEENERRLGHPNYMTAIGLLIQGTENCLQYIAPPDPEPVVVPKQDEPEIKPPPSPDGRTRNPRPANPPKGKSGLGRFIDRIRQQSEDLFSDKDFYREDEGTQKSKNDE